MVDTEHTFFVQIAAEHWNCKEAVPKSQAADYKKKRSTGLRSQTKSITYLVEQTAEDLDHVSQKSEFFDEGLHFKSSCTSKEASTCACSYVRCTRARIARTGFKMADEK